MTLTVTVRVAVDDVDVVVDHLWLHDPEAVGEESCDGQVELTASFADQDDARRAVEALAPWAPRLTEIVSDDYLDGWRAHAGSVRVGRIVIHPVWLVDDSVAGEVVVHIEPGRTFGSGAHASTRGVLAAMQHLALEGARVLDVGCGSGVLSLAACALGASRVEGIDIDPGAVEVARDNAERNGVEDRFVVTLGPLNQVAGPFDVVLANVLGVVLVELADHLVRVTGPAGVLVVSGMLTGATSRVERALRPLEVRSRTTTDGWETVVLARPTS